MPDTPTTRLPPHNAAAEAAFLGACLLDPTAVAVGIDRGVVPEAFYVVAHQHVWSSVTKIHNAGDHVDAVTVLDDLQRQGVADQIGGAAFLASLQIDTPGTTAAEKYAQIIVDHFVLRRMISAATEITDFCYQQPDDPAVVVEEAERRIADMLVRRTYSPRIWLRDAAAEQLDYINQIANPDQDLLAGIVLPTGFPTVDAALHRGFRPQQMVVIGARPSMGKALALTTELPTPHGWTTMGDVQVGDRLFDLDGQVCTVTAVTPVQHGRRCYQVRFDDGSVIVADADHRWCVHDPDGLRVVTTQQMIDEGIRSDDGGLRWHLPLAAPPDLIDVELPVDPYLFGRCVAGDVEQPATDTEQGRVQRIPVWYMRGSFKQRLALLEGITDVAAVSVAGTVEVRLPDRQLVEQVRELVASLGHKPSAVTRRQSVSSDGTGPVSWAVEWVPVDDRSEPVCEPGPGRSHLCRTVVAVIPTVSVPVKCIAVNSATRTYLVGRGFIPTHNTSFAAQISLHAAEATQRPVLFYSLEMTRRDLSERFLAAATRVPYAKLRRGELGDEERDLLNDAVKRFEAIPFHINDAGVQTLASIRQDARRFRAEHGDLAMVVIDYLQLMQQAGESRHHQSRQEQVSEISRGIKMLAGELDCTAVALSQLSRKLEDRDDKRPRLDDLRESGCLTAGTLVWRADADEPVPIGDIAGQQMTDIPVWSVDGDNKPCVATMTHAFCTGIKPVHVVRLVDGTEITATGNHPFLTPHGWTSVRDLKPGFVVARMTPNPFRDQHLVWVAVAAVIPVGEQLVFDATVEPTHCFVADGAVVHNSIEQDADIVCMLYRDDKYHPDSPDAGTAEVILAKHRAGATGVMRLAFLDRFTLFASMPGDETREPGDPIDQF